MKKIVIILLIQFLFKSHFAQTNSTEWLKTYGGIGEDIARSVQQTTDGGYIIAGTTTSFGSGNRDGWLIKTNAFGDTLWSKTFGGSNYDWVESVQQTTDGGYILAGTTGSFISGYARVWLIKTDFLGNTIWTKTFGKSWEYGHAVEQTIDDGYIIVGMIDTSNQGFTDIWLTKTDSLGNALWTKTFGGSDSDWGWSVQQTTDEGYIIVGDTKSFGVGERDIWLIKTNTSGDTIWTKTFGGIGDDGGESVQQTTNGEYIITGFSVLPGHSDYDVWLIKTNTNGQTRWTKKFGGINDDIGFSINQTSDGGYIISGVTNYLFGGSDGDFWLIKTDTSGDTLWTRIFGGAGDDWSYSVDQTSDGGYILTGFTRSFGAGYYDFWLIKTKEDGTIPVELQKFSAEVSSSDVKLLWSTVTETNNQGFEILRFAQNDNNDWEKVGFVPGFGTSTEVHNYSFVDESLQNGIYKYKLKQIDFDGSFEYSNIIEVTIDSPTEFSLEQNYPNPFNPSTKIKLEIPGQARNDIILVTLKVYDVLGTEIATLVNEEKATGTYEVEFNGNRLPSGIYFYQLKAGSFIQTKKMLLLK